MYIGDRDGIMNWCVPWNPLVKGKAKLKERGGFWCFGK